MKITISYEDIERLIVKEMKNISKDKYQDAIEEDRIYYRTLIKAANVILEHYSCDIS